MGGNGREAPCPDTVRDTGKTKPRGCIPGAVLLGREVPRGFEVSCALSEMSGAYVPNPLTSGPLLCLRLNKMISKIPSRAKSYGKVKLEKPTSGPGEKRPHRGGWGCWRHR